MFLTPSAHFKRVSGGGGGSPAFTGSRVFDGTDGYISLGDVADMALSDWTGCIWFKTTDTNFNLFSKSLYGANADRYGLYVSSSTFTAILSSSLQNVNVTWSGGAVLDGSWHLAIAQWDRDGSLALYVDDVSRASLSITISEAQDITSTHDLLLGRYNSGTGIGPHATDLKLNGNLADFRIYNRILSSGEKTDLFTDGRASTVTSGLVVHLPLSEGTESLVDQSGNGNDGTNNGTTASSDGPED